METKIPEFHRYAIVNAIMHNTKWGCDFWSLTAGANMKKYIESVKLFQQTSAMQYNNDNVGARLAWWGKVK